MKKTTEAMHRGLSNAVIELRRRMNWGQEDLARQINRHGARPGSLLASTKQMISGWENGEHAPSPVYRAALGRIAEKHEATEDLAAVFRAPTIAWRLVAHVKLGLKDGEK